MKASDQTLKMVRLALSSDSGVTEPLTEAVIGLLTDGVQGYTPEPADELLVPSEVRARLKISERTLWRLEKRGELVPCRIGRVRRYSRKEVETYLKSILPSRPDLVESTAAA